MACGRQTRAADSEPRGRGDGIKGGFGTDIETERREGTRKREDCARAASTIRASAGDWPL